MFKQMEMMDTEGSKREVYLRSEEIGLQKEGFQSIGSQSPCVLKSQRGEAETNARSDKGEEGRGTCERP